MIPALARTISAPRATGRQTTAPVRDHQPRHRASTWPRRIVTLPQDFSQNQHLPTPPDLSSELSAVVSSFKPSIRYAIAYGSAVFPQASYSSQHAPMLDFIFAVSHPNHWHGINLQHNPHHYSIPARLAGCSAIAWLQERGPGAGIWYNVGVKVNQRVIKYGVISIDALCDDLIDWQTLYVSGRMHKPTHIIRDDARVRLAQQVNLASALRTALLLLPEKFDEVQLYRSIAGLSYTGDIRMKWGENPKKVDNILEQQSDFFRTLYRPLINALKSHIHPANVSNHVSNHTTQFYLQDPSPRARAELLNKLPIKLKQKIQSKYHTAPYLSPDRSNASSAQQPYPGSDLNDLEVSTRIVSDPSFDLHLRQSLVDIIRYPSLFQSLKGLVSAGAVKSLKYASSKVMKRFGG